MAADIMIMRSGTLYGFKPVSPDAVAWFHDNVASDGWQWLGSVLWVDQRCAEPLAELCVHAGFTLK